MSAARWQSAERITARARRGAASADLAPAGREPAVRRGAARARSQHLALDDLRRDGADHQYDDLRYTCTVYEETFTS